MARKGARVEPQDSQGNACRADALTPLLEAPGEALVGGFPLLCWPELSALSSPPCLHQTRTESTAEHGVVPTYTPLTGSLLNEELRRYRSAAFLNK